jgi:hypothetical protein
VVEHGLREQGLGGKAVLAAADNGHKNLQTEGESWLVRKVAWLAILLLQMIIVLTSIYNAICNDLAIYGQ